MSNLEDSIFEDVVGDFGPLSPEPDPVKQVIILRTDIGMTPGKAAAQAAHASISWLIARMDIDRLTRKTVRGIAHFSESELTWINGAFTKIVLQVPNELQLRQYHRWADEAGLESHLIIDSGRTVFGGVPTATAVAIGPNYNERIDKVTSGLRLYY
jgi:peptidyl-tRNA hydrolase, PTH2 family